MIVRAKDKAKANIMVHFLGAEVDRNE